DITKLILSDLKDMENQEFIDTMDKYFNIIKELKKYNNVNILQKIYKLLIDNLHKIEENISEETKNESFFYKLLFYADTLISNYGYIIDSYKSGFDSSTFLLVVLNHNNPDLYKDFINLEKELKYYNIKT
ncbi:MAG: hypothetical protein N3A54_00005, partial [Patescibacteria group bacterium]|nr:hypothetical protein [Patescibacteria group bacterium]